MLYVSLCLYFYLLSARAKVLIMDIHGIEEIQLSSGCFMPTKGEADSAWRHFGQDLRGLGVLGVSLKMFEVTRVRCDFLYFAVFR